MTSGGRNRILEDVVGHGRDFHSIVSATRSHCSFKPWHDTILFTVLKVRLCYRVATIHQQEWEQGEQFGGCSHAEKT